MFINNYEPKAIRSLGLRRDIVEMMFREQRYAGNRMSIVPFQVRIDAGTRNGGFTWERSFGVCRGVSWVNVIMYHDTKTFDSAYCSLNNSFLDFRDFE